jgi:D-arabinose 1-dehydrogenase-like Zn-dependent alcohol dehydrogenase
MDTNPNPETASESAGSADTSCADFSSLFAAAGHKAVQAAALQSLANALTLTLHNAVAEQQHSQMLRMAFTSAAASAILDGKRSEAEEILNLAKSSLVSPDLSGIMSQIKTYLDTIALQMHPSTPSNPESAS